MLDIQNKKVTVIGAQRSAQALVHLIKNLGGIPRISEQQTEESLKKEFLEEIKHNAWAFECQGHTEPFLQDSDIVVLSPGVSITSQVAQWANNHEIPLLGEIEFAYQFCSKPVIAVTGSNGKTTVVTLIGEVLKKAGLRPIVCGNVGYPFSDYVLDLQDKNYVVLEISSFQLESVLTAQQIESISSRHEYFRLKGFQPHIAVFLNFNQNHLDRHKDLEEYWKAKMNIFLNQDKRDFAVLNLHDERIKAQFSRINSEVRFFEPSKKNGQRQSYDANQSAACEVANILDIEEKIVYSSLESFQGLEHRLEWVRQIDGIDFINDSKATTVDACFWCLSQVDRPIVMICGGKDKNLDFSRILQAVERKVKTMFVIGESRKKLKQTFERVIPVEECDELEMAVQKARARARKGDCVILSPMCSSFDMFQNFEHRGRMYKDIVNNLE